MAVVPRRPCVSNKDSLFEALFLLGSPTPAPRDCLLIVPRMQQKMTLLCIGERTERTKGNTAELETLSLAPLGASCAPLGPLGSFRHPRNMEGARLLSLQGQVEILAPPFTNGVTWVKSHSPSRPW